MIGGALSFQGGSYSRTPIEEILPVSFQDTAIRFIDKEYLPKINVDFFNHPILRLEKDLQLNQEVWDSLPPLQGANLGLVASKNAYVLVNFQNEKGNSGSFCGLSRPRAFWFPFVRIDCALTTNSSSEKRANTPTNEAQSICIDSSVSEDRRSANVRVSVAS